MCTFDLLLGAETSRPDDIEVIMAMGDSITGAFLAKAPWPQSALDSQHPLSAMGSFEDRGVSYPIGGDPGAITIATILEHYSNVTGASTGSHPRGGCIAGLCTGVEGDGLNAAVGGSVAASMRGQVESECGLGPSEWGL